MSFEVICINNKPLKNGTDWKVLHMIQEGMPYYVVEIKENGGYILSETYKEQYRVRGALCPSRFVRTSDIDERDRLEACQQWQGIVKKGEGLI